MPGPAERGPAAALPLLHCQCCPSYGMGRPFCGAALWSPAASDDRHRGRLRPAQGANVSLGTVKMSSVPFDSDALRANIATTAQTVVVPDRFVPLLDAVDGFHGVRTSLADLLDEYFHTFRNNGLLVEGFQTVLLRNWPYFERSDSRGHLFGLLAELVQGLLDAPLSDDQFSLLLRGLLMWCTEALAGPPKT